MNFHGIVKVNQLKQNIYAIDNYPGSRKDLKGSRIYVDLFPCNECAKDIIQAGIKEVIYLSDKYEGTDANVAAKLMFDTCGVSYRKLEDKYQLNIELSLKPDEKIKIKK